MVSHLLIEHVSAARPAQISGIRVNSNVTPRVDFKLLVIPPEITFPKPFELSI